MENLRLMVTRTSDGTTRRSGSGEKKEGHKGGGIRHGLRLNKGLDAKGDLVRCIEQEGGVKRKKTERDLFGVGPCTPKVDAFQGGDTRLIER